VDETAECVALTEPFLLLPVLDEPVAAVLKPDWVAVADEEPADEFPEDNDEVEDAVEDAEDEEDWEDPDRSYSGFWTYLDYSANLRKQPNFK